MKKIKLQPVCHVLIAGNKLTRKVTNGGPRAVECGGGNYEENPLSRDEKIYYLFLLTR